MEQQLKEESVHTKKTREREEEEYNYSLQLTRKKDTDAYQERKLKLEKELTDKKVAFESDMATREARIQEVEAELNSLRALAAGFPAEVEKAVKNAEKYLTEKLQTQYKFETELTSKQTDGEIKLKEQTILTLQNKIKDLEVIIKELTSKANTAEASVKDIAIKAIESSTKIQFVEKAKES